MYLFFKVKKVKFIRRSFNRFFLVLFGLILFSMMAVSNHLFKLNVVDFSVDDLTVFKQEVFTGKTNYQVIFQEGNKVLRAEANASASSLYRELSIDLLKTPYLNWSWRVGSIYTSDDQLSKQGDDYPARIYVLFQQGFFPWQVKAINYVCSSNVMGLSYWESPYSANVIIIPLRSGSEGLGQWHKERVNVAEDYYRVFGKKTDSAHAVAIMTDADNAGGSAVSYYGNLYFSE